MRFVVRHRSRYAYDVPVTLGDHVLRLSPREEGAELREHHVVVVPEPVVKRPAVDRFGNRVVELGFRGTTQELAVDSALVVDTCPTPAVRVLLPPLPWSLDGALAPDYYGTAPVDAAVRRFAEGLAREVSYGALAFLDLLAETLATRFERQLRPSGAAHPAAETLVLGRGACRDLTVLFMEACRCLGLASRFVSGYQAHADAPSGERHMHAWPEVHLPGAGFRGWDPTHGARVDHEHLALCAAPSQAGTMPIEGGFTFEGPTVRSTLDFMVHIQTT